MGNVYAYDAQGRPLVGVQLVDQDGRRLTVEPGPVATTATQQQSVHTPWLNGRTELYSVFPLPEQRRPDEYGGQPTGSATMQTPPFASLPPVSLAGVQPSVLVPPATVEAQRQAALEAGGGAGGEEGGGAEEGAQGGAEPLATAPRRFVSRTCR